MDENLNYDEETLARVRKLQKEESLNFDEAVKIVQLELMKQIKKEIYRLPDAYKLMNGLSDVAM